MMECTMSELDSELVISFLDESTDLLNNWENICLKLESEQSPSEIDAFFRIAHNLKGSSRAVGLLSVGDFIHVLEDVIVELKENKKTYSSKMQRMFLEAHSIMTDWFTVLRLEHSYIYSTHDFIKKYFNENHEFIQEDADVAETELKTIQDPALKKENQDDSEHVDNKVLEIKTNVKDETLRISTKKIDGLLSLIGELSIQQSILENSINNRIFNNQDSVMLSSLNLSRKITKEIYSTAFGLRMTPIGGIFQRLERAIKDLARDLGKNVEIEFNGTEVEIEKTILDKLIDPLIHIVRNSVDHGIEMPSDRDQKKKPIKGKIVISASKEGDGVKITIADDGKGLNEKKILEKAIEKGLVKEQNSLTKEDVLGLIFLPGFSTAEKVTNVSGRGVGMDVVMKTLEEIDGKIFIASEVERGTKFKITIPTSLSIVDSLIVSINENLYVLPINALEEVVDDRMTGLRKDNSLYLFRGQAVPFVHLGSVLGGIKQDSPEMIPILVTKVHGKRFAVGVDKIIGQHQSVVRNLSNYFSHSYAVAGGTILPSGEPGLILNISAIAEKYFKYFKLNSEVSA